MANKKTVVEQYDAIKAMLNGETVEGYTLADALAFVDKRIEITKNKNAGNKNGELTPKQKEKLAETEGRKAQVLAVMNEGVAYSPSEIVKVLADPNIANTQKLTPLLTALVTDGKVVKATVKGRSVYSLPTAEVDETED